MVLKEGDGGLVWRLVGVEWMTLCWCEVCVCGEWCVCSGWEGFERGACCIGGLSMLCS